jgi:hypothetical protein
MKKILLTAGALLLSMAVPAFAHDDDYQDYFNHQLDHEEHGDFHRDFNEAHAEAHDEGFASRGEHRAWHQAYENTHERFHEDHPATWHDHYRSYSRPYASGRYGYYREAYPQSYGYAYPQTVFSFGYSWGR